MCWFWGLLQLQRRLIQWLCVVLEDLVFLPSMGKHHDKAIFSHGVNKVAAAPSFKSKAHRLGNSPFLSNHFNKGHVAISEPVTVARVMSCAGQFLLKRAHPWRWESDQLLLRYLPVSSTHLFCNHILSFQASTSHIMPGYFLRISQLNSVISFLHSVYLGVAQTSLMYCYLLFIFASSSLTFSRILFTSPYSLQYRLDFSPPSRIIPQALLFSSIFSPATC